MALSTYKPLRGTATSSTAIGSAEFDILKSSHKFLRDENDDDGKDGRTDPWNARLAQKYYDSLYREFAVCDLKHYKSGNFALRWRTESEVLSGAGEESCGNTRCPHHHPAGPSRAPSLTTLELPFSYSEHGEHKSALVKVVLCARCCKKLMWKRQKDKEREGRKKEGEGQGDRVLSVEGSGGSEGEGRGEDLSVAVVPSVRRRHSLHEDDYEKSVARRDDNQGRIGGERSSHQRERGQERRADRGRVRSSRSRSPRRQKESKDRSSHRSHNSRTS